MTGCGQKSCCRLLAYSRKPGIAYIWMAAMADHLFKRLMRVYKRQDMRALMVLSILVLTTFLVYHNLLNADFLYYDDPDNVVQNPAVHELSVQSLHSMFTSSIHYSYNPLTFLSYAIEYRLFGPDPRYFHLDNIILHLLNIVLLYLFMAALTGQRPLSLFIAALFALHPMLADVVGWISARNYLLAMLFFLSSAIFYLQYLGYSKKKWMRFGLSVLFFILACLSKSQAVILAPLLVFMNWYRGESIKGTKGAVIALYFLIATGIGLLTIFFRTDMGQAEVVPDYSMMQRVLVIGMSMVGYIFKAVFPVGLTAIESYPTISEQGLLPVMAYVSPLLLAAAITLLLRYAGKAPLLVLGFACFFMGILITQLSFLEDGYSANRYFYLSSPGLFLMFAYAAQYALKRFYKVKPAMYIVGIALLLSFAFIASRRSTAWKDTGTLTARIIRTSPDVAMAHNIRGIYHYKNQQLNESLQDFNRAIKYCPGYSSSFYNRGLSYAASGDHKAAISDYDRAIVLNPGFASAYIARGVVFLSVVKDFSAAIGDFNNAIGIDPGSAMAYYNRGLAYFRMRNTDMACHDWQMVKELGYRQADHMLARYCK